MSHYGFIAPQKFPITPLKVIGALAVIGGVILIRWQETGQTQSSTPTSLDVVVEKPAGTQD